MEESRLRTYSPLSLAFLGDAVYSLIVRKEIVEDADRPVHELHEMSSGIVSAVAQAAMMEHLLPFLSEEEEGVYRRGKNAKTISGAKNASSAAYHKATGFESLLGWLYLKGDMERIYELLEIGRKASELNCTH